MSCDSWKYLAECKNKHIHDHAKFYEFKKIDNENFWVCEKCSEKIMVFVDIPAFTYKYIQRAKTNSYIKNNKMFRWYEIYHACRGEVDGEGIGLTTRHDLKDGSEIPMKDHHKWCNGCEYWGFKILPKDIKQELMDIQKRDMHWKHIFMKIRKELRIPNE